MTPTQLIFTIHGIHNGRDTFGDLYRDWAAKHAPQYGVREINWGRITGVQMYLSRLIPCRMAARRKAAFAMWPLAADSAHVIAHSYGTQFITDLLWSYPDIKIDGLVLVGSVLTERFHKTRLPALIANGQVSRVLNVWSPNDSIIRNWSKWPYGTAGATGFVDLDGTEPVWQNETQEEHSTYFWSEFRDEHFARWTNWLAGNPL